MSKPSLNNENKLLFFNWKKDRKTKLEIYNKAQIKFSGPCSYSGLTIPVRLRDFVELPTDTSVKDYVTCDYEIITKNGETLKWYTNIKSEIHYKGNKWLIQPKVPSERERILLKNVRNDWILKCELAIFNKRNTQLKPTALLTQAEATATMDLSIIDELEPVISYDYKTKKVAIYQDARGIIYVKVTGILCDYGAFHLNQYIGQYITNWFETEDLYYASLEGQTPIVIPSVICKRKARGGRVSKHLLFPYWGEEKEAEVIFSSPKMTFTPTAVKAIKTRVLLQERGVQLQGLLTKVWKSNNHKNKDFATQVKNILQRYNDGTPNKIFLPETALEIKSMQNETAYKHCFDHLSIDSTNSSFELIIGEVISSISKCKNRVIDEEIALLHFYKRLLGRNCLALLFINEEITSKTNSIVTDYYALAANILILGIDQMKQCQFQQNYFSQLIKTYQRKQAQLQTPNQVIHPKSTTILHQQELFNEALLLLLSIFSKPRISREAAEITDYCRLVEIGKKDFWLLKKDGQRSEKKELVKVWLAKQPTSIISSELKEKVFNNNQLLEYLYIHYKLTTDQSIVFVSIKSKLSPLSSHQDLLKKFLPSSVKVHRVNKAVTAGSAFERFIAKKLIDENYNTLCNIYFSFAQREFEIDILALNTKELLFISCKDHSTITDKNQAEKFIQIASNRLAFHCSLCNATSGRLYFKANPAYSKVLKTLYHNTYWTKQVQLFILD